MKGQDLTSEMRERKLEIDMTVVRGYFQYQELLSWYWFWQEYKQL